MPESRRRNRKYDAPTGRQKIAAIDGTVIRLRACCAIDIVIGHPVAHAYHHEKCRVPTDRSDGGYLARVRVMTALAGKLRHRGIDTIVLIDSRGSEPRLLLR